MDTLLSEEDQTRVLYLLIEGHRGMFPGIVEQFFLGWLKRMPGIPRSYTLQPYTHSWLHETSHSDALNSYCIRSVAQPDVVLWDQAITQGASPLLFNIQNFRYTLAHQL